MHRDNLAKARTHLLVKDRFGLPTITRLFAIVPTLPLSSERIFTLLVLCHFVRAIIEDIQLMNERGNQRHDIRVLPAIFVRAVCHVTIINYLPFAFLKRTRTHMSGGSYDV
jgi:hypothetical protein